MDSIRHLGALLTVAAITALPLGAFAQAQPTDAPAADAAPPAASAPSYGRPSFGSDEDVIRGRIVSFDGGYNMQVRDDRGYIDNVVLHQGTIINPTGLRLTPGMSVTVRGVNQGRALAANQIDTPYQTYGYGYPAGPYPYVYPYGYPYPGYGYGVGVAVGVGLGYWGAGCCWGGARWGGWSGGARWGGGGHWH